MTYEFNSWSLALIALALFVIIIKKNDIESLNYCLIFYWFSEPWHRDTVYCWVIAKLISIFDQGSVLPGQNKEITNYGDPHRKHLALLFWFYKIHKFSHLIIDEYNLKRWPLDIRNGFRWWFWAPWVKWWWSDHHFVKKNMQNSLFLCAKFSPSGLVLYLQLTWAV